MKRYIKCWIDYDKYIDTNDTSDIDLSEGNCTDAIFNTNKNFFSKYLKFLSCEGDLDSNSNRNFITIKFLPRFGDTSNYYTVKLRCPITPRKCGEELKEYIIDEYHNKYLDEIDNEYSISSKNLKVIDELDYLTKKIKSLIDCSGTYYDFCWHKDEPRFEVSYNRYGIPAIYINKIPNADITKVQEFIDDYNKFSPVPIETQVEEEKRHLSIPNYFRVGLHYPDAKLVVDSRMQPIKYITNSKY